MAQQYRFPGTAWAHQDKDFSGLDIEVDAIEHHLGTKGFAELADTDGHSGFKRFGSGHGFRILPPSSSW